MQTRRLEYHRSPSSITIAPPSKDPRNRHRATLSPQDALPPQQSYGFPRQPKRQPSHAARASHKINQSPPQWVQSTPELQSLYMMDPNYRRPTNETMAPIQAGRRNEYRPMSPLPRPFAQPLPPPPLPLIACAGKRSSSPSHSKTIAPPISRLSSASPALPVRETAMNKLRQVMSRNTSSVNWRELPPPVLACVLVHLRTLHLQERSRSCNTCHMRDLCAVQMSCRAWSAAAQKHL